jgi:hypothetical protein
MNIPCPVCNFLTEQRRMAFIRREYAALRYYEEQHEQHRAKCEIINSSWYKGLWQSARIGVDVVPAGVRENG